MQDAEFYHRADELAALARARECIDRLEGRSIEGLLSYQDHGDLDNLLHSIRWFTNAAGSPQDFSVEERTKRVSITPVMEKLRFALLPVLLEVHDKHWSPDATWWRCDSIADKILTAYGLEDPPAGGLL